MELNIPKKFNLGGLTIDVELVDYLVKTKGAIGEAKYSEQKILIDTTAAPEESTEQSFYHELIHYILYVMNKDDLRNNEEFVDVFAHLLYQALKTGNYGRDRNMP